MRTKSLDPELNEAARRFVDAVVKKRFGGNKKLAAAAFGISGSVLGEFLGGTRGAGMKLLGGVARFTGQPIDAIVSNRLTVVREDGGTRWREMPAWKIATQRARETYRGRLPDVAFDHGGDFFGSAPPTVIDERTVYNAAKLWWESRNEEEQSDALAAQAQAEMDAEDREAEGLLLKGQLRDELHPLALTEGAKVSPPTAKRRKPKA